MGLIEEIIALSFKEDFNQLGDISALSCVPKDAEGKAKLLVKDNGVIAGIELAKKIFHIYDDTLKFKSFVTDGSSVKIGDIAFEIQGKSRSILATERLVLNFMQRMSAIATETRKVATLINDTSTKLLDTRKTTPGIRALEKWAVQIGGGHNHRMGLYDMIMLKDNHIDYAGGVEAAILKANAYRKSHQLGIKIEIEVRDEMELHEVLKNPLVDRIMLDNFTPEKIKEVLPLIPTNIETEASGGINIKNIRAYAESGIDYISSGALTHSVKSLDLSLKAEFK